jgi:hypothetical protein
MARSYDPSVLGAITGADGDPDIEEAATWYRRWHALSVEQGLVADSVSVERLIRRMR